MTGRRRSRSTHAPASNPTSSRPTYSRLRSAAISSGPAARTRIAASGSAVRVTYDPTNEIVDAVHRRTNAPSRQMEFTWASWHRWHDDFPLSGPTVPSTLSRRRDRRPSPPLGPPSGPRDRCQGKGSRCEVPRRTNGSLSGPHLPSAGRQHAIRMIRPPRTCSAAQIARPPALSGPARPPALSAPLLRPLIRPACDWSGAWRSGGRVMHWACNRRPGSAGRGRD